MTKTVANKLPHVREVRPMLGCDPEFFFKSTDGDTVGAEKILPKTGLIVGGSKFIIDGVQAELNPAPETCRALLANNMKSCFQTLAEHMKQHKDITVDFSRTTEISKKNLEELSEDARKFGCAPSFSTYETKLKIQDVDPMEYRTRAAGGHIHIGHHCGTEPGPNAHNYHLYMALTANKQHTVDMLDIICGNTMVLLDLDPSNVERRKMYGRAGEHRTPKHGLEYRTLSNFWLTAYPLMSLAFGLARTAVQLMADKDNNALYYNEFTKMVNMKDVQEAINNNDFDLAMQNFKAIAPLLCQVNYAPHDEGCPINNNTLDAFYYFVESSKKEGIQKWFKQDPMTHWCNLPEAHRQGAYEFLGVNVKEELNKFKKAA